MAKFRKKPVEIEAHQWDGDWEAVVRWMESIGPGGFAFPPGEAAPIEMNDAGDLVVHTLEGDMIAKRHDWIIRGVEGEFYPCKPSIFESCYERADP